MTDRNTIRLANPQDKNLTTLNKEIDKLIETHKSNLWKEKLDENWDHKQITHYGTLFKICLTKTINKILTKQKKTEQNKILHHACEDPNK